MINFTMPAFTVAMMVATSVSMVNAQDPATQARKGVQSADAGKLDSKTSGSNIRFSQLIGANLQNDAGDSVGEINDLVLDSRTGRVRYAAVTYGGFLGLGDKLFAVPFEAIKTKADRQDAGEYVLVLNVTQAQLEGAQGFDQDNWPNMADKNFAMELDRRYGVDRMRDRKRGSAGNDVDVDRDGVDVNRDK